MRKTKPIQISIPHPCTQSWDEMTPDGQGRHCALCQKTVIDFTTWSDTALYNYFSRNNEHTCGRFFTTQVNRPLSIPFQPHSRLYRLTVALGLTLIFTQLPTLSAQNRLPAATLIAPFAQRSLPISDDTTLCGEIRALVLDAQGQPMDGVRVQLFDSIDSPVASRLSQGNGYCVFEALRPGRYTIVALYRDADTVKSTVDVHDKPVFQQLQLTHIFHSNVIQGGIMPTTYFEQYLDKPTNTTITREQLSHMPR